MSVEVRVDAPKYGFTSTQTACAGASNSSTWIWLCAMNEAAALIEKDFIQKHPGVEV